MATTKINIAIAEGDALIREGLALLISAIPGFNVIIQAANAQDLLQQLDKEEERIVCLIDTHIGGAHNFIKDHLKKWQNVRFIALAQYHEEYTQKHIIKSGGFGYLLKDSKIAALKEAIQIVSTGGIYFSNMTLTEYNSIKEKKVQFQSLTSTQITLIELLVKCLSYEEMGKVMGVKARSIESKRDLIKKKIHINSKEGLTVFALRTGIGKIC